MTHDPNTPQDPQQQGRPTGYPPKPPPPAQPQTSQYPPSQYPPSQYPPGQYSPADYPPLVGSPSHHDPEWRLARKRVQARRGLSGHAAAYIVVNLFLIVVWALSGGGYFWPVWVLAGWGVGLVLNAWEVLWRRPITEAEIEREIQRGRQGRRPGP